MNTPTRGQLARRVIWGGLLLGWGASILAETFIAARDAATAAMLAGLDVDPARVEPGEPSS